MEDDGVWIKIPDQFIKDGKIDVIGFKDYLTQKDAEIEIQYTVCH